MESPYKTWKSKVCVCVDQVMRTCVQLQAIYLRGGDDDSVAVDSHYTA